MAKVNQIQNAFNAGELTPRLEGRTDFKGYFQGLQRAENVLPTPYGTIERPQGTRFLNSTKDNGVARLIEFEFSTEQTYVLEFGDEYIRFYKDEGQIIVESADSWVTSTAYVVGDFVDESGTIYYCLEDHTSGVFATDLAANKWVAQVEYEIPAPYGVGELDDIFVTQSADVLFIYHPDYMIRELTRTSHTSWTITEHETKWGPFLDINTTSTTLNPSATTGNITITASADVFFTGHIGSQWALHGGYVKITGRSDAQNVTATVIEDLSASTATADWEEGAWSTYRGFPSCGTFHEQRLVSAATNYEPRTFWGSKQFIYDDHEVDTTKDDYAYSFECASEQVNAIKWLSSGQRLSIGTSDSVWTAYAVNASITANNIIVARQHSKGTADIRPHVIGASTYYVSADARKVWEHGFDFNINGYDADDMTLSAEHITLSGIKETCLQTIPNNYLWCVLNNGKLITMLRDKKEAVTGWVSHDTESGDASYESIACIRESNADQVWVIVNRTIDGVTKRYVEFFENTYTPDDKVTPVINCKEDLFYVHSGLTYDDPIDITGITKADPAVVTAADHGFSNGDIVRIISVSGMTEVNDANFTVANKTTNTFELSGVDSTDYGTYSSGGEVRVYTNTLTGLSHLEGKEVAILANGNAHAPKTVSSGSITLDRSVVIAQVGLPYTSVIQTMRTDAGSFQGSAQGKKKRLVEAVVRLYRSLAFVYGNDNTEYEYTENQTIWDESEELFSGDKYVLTPALWDRAGRLILKQYKPFPFNLVALMINVETS